MGSQSGVARSNPRKVAVWPRQPAADFKGLGRLSPRQLRGVRFRLPHPHPSPVALGPELGPADGARVDLVVDPGLAAPALHNHALAAGISLLLPSTRCSRLSYLRRNLLQALAGYSAVRLARQISAQFANLFRHLCAHGARTQRVDNGEDAGAQLLKLVTTRPNQPLQILIRKVVLVVYVDGLPLRWPRSIGQGNREEPMVPEGGVPGTDSSGAAAAS